MPNLSLVISLEFHSGIVQVPQIGQRDETSFVNKIIRRWVCCAKLQINFLAQNRNKVSWIYTIRWVWMHSTMSDVRLRIISNVWDGCKRKFSSKHAYDQYLRSLWNADTSCLSLQRSEFIASQRSNISTSVLRSDALHCSQQCNESLICHLCSICSIVETVSQIASLASFVFFAILRLKRPWRLNRQGLKIGRASCRERV